MRSALTNLSHNPSDPRQRRASRHSLKPIGRVVHTRMGRKVNPRKKGEGRDEPAGKGLAFYFIFSRFFLCMPYRQGQRQGRGCMHAHMHVCACAPQKIPKSAPKQKASPSISPPPAVRPAPAPPLLYIYTRTLVIRPCRVLHRLSRNRIGRADGRARARACVGLFFRGREEYDG